MNTPTEKTAETKSKLIEVSWQDGGLVVELGAICWIILAGISALWLFLYWKRFSRKNDFYTDSITISYGKGLKQTLKQNHDTVRLAHQAYIELQTRKVGLEFDPEHDVITEVYDSWYAAFGLIRELVKSIPAEHLRKCGDTNDLSQLLVDVLNEGMRPHLTRWQAKFRRWYEKALNDPENDHRTPQEVQILFPMYEELIDDLKQVNKDFTGFTKDLRVLALKENTASK